MEGPLCGVRVLDLSRMLPGAFCTRQLADLGADVIKIEEPANPDPARGMGFGEDTAEVDFAALHHGKRAAALNLKHPEGRKALLRLVAGADVLLEGFRPGAMGRLGLGYDHLRQVNPRLVYCSLSGYGQTGPYRERAGHDLNYQAVSGVLWLSGGHDGAPPLPSLPWADLAGGSNAALSIVAALLAARAKGSGRYLDLSMLDGMLGQGQVPAAQARATGRNPVPRRQALQGALACYAIYRTSDGRHLTVAALEPKFWQVLCLKLDRPELMPIQMAPDQQEHIRAVLQAVFATKTCAEWLSLVGESDACIEPVLSPCEALGHPQVVERGGAGELPPAPGVGQHTAEVLLEAGLTPDEIAGLFPEGAIA